MSRTAPLESFSPHLFWDVARDGLDVEKHKSFLIARVMDRGTHEDVRRVYEVFTEEEILVALLSARSLARKTITYFSARFNVPRNQFRAYKPAFEGTWQV